MLLPSSKAVSASADLRVLLQIRLDLVRAVVVHRRPVVRRLPDHHGLPEQAVEDPRDARLATAWKPVCLR